MGVTFIRYIKNDAQNVNAIFFFGKLFKGNLKVHFYLCFSHILCLHLKNIVVVYGPKILQIVSLSKYL